MSEVLEHLPKKLSLKGVKSVFLDSLSVRYCARFCEYIGEQDRCSLLLWKFLGIGKDVQQKCMEHLWNKEGKWRTFQAKEIMIACTKTL